MDLDLLLSCQLLGQQGTSALEVLGYDTSLKTRSGNSTTCIAIILCNFSDKDTSVINFNLLRMLCLTSCLTEWFVCFVPLTDSLHDLELARQQPLPKAYLRLDSSYFPAGEEDVDILNKFW